MHRHRNKRKWHRAKYRCRSLKARINALTERNGLYRSRKGILMGVCKGLANHFDVSVFWVRVIVFILFLFTGFWPVGVLYILTGLLLKAEPVSPLKNQQDQDFYDTYMNSRQSAIQRIKRKFENIERRIQRMEHTVTSKEFNWK